MGTVHSACRQAVLAVYSQCTRSVLAVYSQCTRGLLASVVGPRLHVLDVAHVRVVVDAGQQEQHRCARLARPRALRRPEQRHDPAVGELHLRPYVARLHRVHLGGIPARLERSCASWVPSQVPCCY